MQSGVEEANYTHVETKCETLEPHLALQLFEGFSFKGERHPD